MKFSVIIPAYNAEKTIRRCLDSLLNQPHENAELIIINDGSADNTGEICKEYASRHGCIRYFEKENGGVSSARNLGLDNAVGEYILFVDSDDYVTENYFAVISDAVEKEKPEMLLFGRKNIGGCVKIMKPQAIVEQKELQIANMVYKVIRKKLLSNLMSKVFVRSIIEKYNLRFNEAICIGEDLAFVFAYIIRIQKLMMIPTVLYNLVLENPDSLSRKKREYLAEQLLQVSLSLMRELQEAQLSQKTKAVYMEGILWSHYRNFHASCKELYKFHLSREERRDKVADISRKFMLGQRPKALTTKILAFPVVHEKHALTDFLAGCLYANNR